MENIKQTIGVDGKLYPHVLKYDDGDFTATLIVNKKHCAVVEASATSPLTVGSIIEPIAIADPKTYKIIEDIAELQLYTHRFHHLYAFKKEHVYRMESFLYCL